MALHAADQVRATGAVFTFGSMTAQERTNHPPYPGRKRRPLTESVGEGAERKLRVGLKKVNT